MTQRLEPNPRLIELGIATATAITAVCALPYDTDREQAFKTLRVLTETMSYLNYPAYIVDNKS